MSEAENLLLTSVFSLEHRDSFPGEVFGFLPGRIFSVICPIRCKPSGLPGDGGDGSGGDRVIHGLGSANLNNNIYACGKNKDSDPPSAT